MKPTTESGTCVCNVFFTKDKEPGESYWRCKYGLRGKKVGSSYEILPSHVLPQHPAYKKLLRVGIDDTQGQLDRYYLSEKMQSYFGLMDSVINELLPFLFFGKSIAQKHNKHERGCVNTFNACYAKVKTSHQKSYHTLSSRYYCPCIR